MKATMKQHQQQRQKIMSGSSDTIVVMRIMTKMMMTLTITMIMITLLCPNNNEGVSALQHILVHHLLTSKNHISRSRSRSSSYNSIPACIIREQRTTMTITTTTSMLMTTSDNNNAAAAAVTTTADVNKNNGNDDKTKKEPNKTKKKQNKTKKKQKGDDDDEKEKKGRFTKSFYNEFNELLKYRRDVRRFYTNDIKPVSEKLIYQLLNIAFTTSPSVGLSEPWKIIHVKSQTAKKNVINNFEKCNKDALQGYSSINNDDDEGHSNTTTNKKAELYSKLKLSGLQEAPIHIAIYCHDSTTKGSGLGIQTMPEIMKQYSCVCGIMSFWLLARAKGIGCGWVSILDPKQLIIDLNLENVVVSSSVVDDWTLIGYLCVGYPNLDNDNDNDINDNYDDGSVVDSGTNGTITSSKRSSTPELELYGWEKRRRGRGRKQKQKQKEQMLQDSSAADELSPSLVSVSVSVSASASASITNGSSSNNNSLDDDFEDSFDDDDDDDVDDDDEDDDDEDDDNDSYDERELPIIIVYISFLKFHYLFLSLSLFTMSILVFHVIYEKYFFLSFRHQYYIESSRRKLPIYS